MKHSSLTDRLAELVDAMIRRDVSILCVQETEWVGEKVRIIKPWGYKLWYIGKDRNRNGVGVIIDCLLYTSPSPRDS